MTTALCLALAAHQLSFAANQTDIDVRSVLAITSVGKGGFVALPTDAIQKQIVEGVWKAPHEGDRMALPSGDPKEWKKYAADKDGWFTGPAFEGGYAYFEVESATHRVALFTATGDSMAYVNGVPHTGDVYGYGWLTLPIELRQGTNTFLVATGREKLKVRMEEPKSPISLNPADLTLPDSVQGDATPHWAAAVVINASDRAATGMTIEAGVNKTPIPTIPPMSVRKVGFKIAPPNPGQTGDQAETITLLNGRTTIDRIPCKVRVRTSLQDRKETYLSNVDGSVQYYAVVPPPNPKTGMAMILSLHGAGVEGIGQADAYSPKDWGYIVCATNRRPFGYDWEDWGRTDGLDVLATAEREYGTDARHTYVTGHSMGGHGTWQFGALFPDRFAAIGVSAGWSSFFSYVGTPRSPHPSPMEDILQRANGTSDTPAMLSNYLSEGVYILHGDQDDNVPVTEARAMRDSLEKLHADLGYHEQKGAGHWWDGPAAPGADCLEWPDMMEFLRRHSLHEPSSFEFTTVNLAVSPSYHGFRVLQQAHPLAPSHLKGTRGSTTTLSTSNIVRFHVPPAWNLGRDLTIDGQAIAISDAGDYELVSARWQAAKPAPSSQIGPFKEVFKNHVALVYGTGGSPDENSWSFAKARLDAETFWYRGNGSVTVISDREALSGGAKGRNVVLYGTADSNLAWHRFLDGAPIQVTRNHIMVGSKQVDRQDVACLFAWRNPGARFMAGAVSGTGVAGLRLTDRLPYLAPGTGFPDWIIDTPDSLSKGVGGVLAAGYFGPDGRVETGECAWRNP